MKHIFTAILMTILLSFTLDAASPKNEKKQSWEKPDMEAIRKEVNNPSSKYYYPKLFKMFVHNDTAMNLKQFRHLYLGYVFQEDYNPYRRSEYSSMVEDLYYRGKHTAAECDTIIKYAELSLKDDPFDLRQMTFLIYAYREKHKNHLASIWQYKLNHILEAIISTGTGLTTENAWIVTNPQHEYNLINFHDYIAESHEDAPPHYDYISIKPKNDKSPKGFYFDVFYVLSEYNRKFPDEPEATGDDDADADSDDDIIDAEQEEAEETQE
ncbi:MAG: DUF4919 domain-containing protein [Bacteroides sp.]|nr:DUF4919 domain-containing protein [Bacteroides sp.]MBD5285084.1 DUF4919 domain-containing protein [Bacteroides sp.]